MLPFDLLSVSALTSPATLTCYTDRQASGCGVTFLFVRQENHNQHTNTHTCTHTHMHKKSTFYMSQPEKQTQFIRKGLRDQDTTNQQPEKKKSFLDLFSKHYCQQQRMSLYGSFLSDEQFQCSICLDVFTNPSSTPCGHSFCMACISRYWDGSKICQCPLCKKTFQKRPDLQINRTLREITDQFKSMTGGGGGGKEKTSRKGGGGGRNGRIPINLFDELKKKLPRHQLKQSMILPCETQGISIPTTPVTSPLASSVPNDSPIAAQTNPFGPPPPPPPFTRSNGRRRFTVTGAASSCSLPVCDIHHRGLVIYCRTDQVSICPECEIEDHSGHDTVTLEAEWMKTKDQLSVSEKEIQEMIRQRIRKIEEIKLSVTDLDLAVERETAGSVCLFSELVSAIQRSQAELMEVMEMSRRAAEHQADAMIRQLELEVEELRRRENALSELAQSDDYMHCVKTFPMLSAPPPAKDWSGVSVNSDLGTGTIYRSLAVLVEKFEEELKVIAETGFPASVLEPSPARSQPRIRRVQEYAVDVTLDCNTAHPRLILSEDMKSVRCGDRHQLLPDNPERFDRVVCVVGREAISSGKHYWEVDVGGKTDWDLGVARQSVNRKGKIEVTPSNGYWFLSLRDKNKYAFRSEPSTDVQLSLRPQRIGIFVDYERGQVSFYDVDAKIHIYTFNDTFIECIFPFFSPCTNKSGKNDGPLIIAPVNIKD
ncbi:nuclear factor 7, brain [Plectropomus leopardus]|uniref:nuclear factor 7, brain n=1 Tax=Plectropomus leopardus TaxID=160734 RepID=UPI001C4D1224|nr:nuclear factor 7, brain [Plectropomus leopardus]